MDNVIEVLDKGYVRLVDVMGSDLSVVNAARVSYDKESPEITEKDSRLLRFLWKHQHTSPFRHAALSFEIYAPLLVARQWYKHAVASAHLDDQHGWNESSRRYVTEEPAFYIPGENEWRTAPENSKQGSGDPLPVENPEDEGKSGKFWTESFANFVDASVDIYNAALEAGICAEQARLFLPAYGMYIRWRWTVSLHAVLNFLMLRIPSDAQKEIQEFAWAVNLLTQESFPETIKAVDA